MSAIDHQDRETEARREPVSTFRYCGLTIREGASYPLGYEVCHEDGYVRAAFVALDDAVAFARAVGRVRYEEFDREHDLPSCGLPTASGWPCGEWRGDVIVRHATHEGCEITASRHEAAMAP